jgi:uridine kinase
MSTSESNKPTMIGLYGISGCGKSYLLNKLKAQLPDDKFAFYDGSTQGP